jgi:hypothetical protein
MVGVLAEHYDTQEVWLLWPDGYMCSKLLYNPKKRSLEESTEIFVIKIGPGIYLVKWVTESHL